MLHTRVGRFMEQIKDDPYDTTIIVSHSNTISSIIHWWLEFDNEMISNVSFDISPCSLTILNKIDWNGNKNISKLNDTCHLQ